MSDYAAPVRDMRFVLNHVLDLEDLSRLPGYEHAEPDLVDQILEEAAKLANGVLGPLNWTGDQQGAQYENGVVRTPEGFADAYRQFCEGGWNGVPFDMERGGGGLPWAVTIPLLGFFYLSPAGRMKFLIPGLSAANLLVFAVVFSMDINLPETDLAALQGAGATVGVHTIRGVGYLLSGDEDEDA